MKQPTETAGAAILAPVQLIKVADIVPDPKNQKRAGGIDVLAASIKREGLLQPVVLRPNPDPKAKAPWMLVAGERRWEAHRLLKLETIEARVRPASLNDSALDSTRKRHAENFHREDLSPIQKAKALQELFDLKMPQAEIAAFVGAKDQSTVSNLCRMLRLPEKVQQLVHNGKLTTAHAKALLKWERWPKICEMIAELALRDETSSKELEDVDGLPWADQLKRAKLAVGFPTSSWREDRFEVTAEMKADPDYVIGSYDSYCLNPEKWEKEKARQLPLIAARQKAAAKRESSSEKSGAAKMSPAEKAKRAKKIADNRRNRAESAAQMEVAFEKLRDLKALEKGALFVVISKVLADGHYASALKGAAQKIGVILPKGLLTSSWFTSVSMETLKTMRDVDALRVAAAAVVMYHGEQAVKFAHGVPDEIEAIAGKAKSSSRPTSCEVTVTISGGDNRARAGSATASNTSSAANAARDAAAKHLGCSAADVELKVKRAGDHGTPALYIASRKGGRK